MADSQIQQLSRQVTQLTSTVKQLEIKIDNLTTIVKSISNNTTQNKTSVGTNSSKPKNEVIPISQTARPKAQTVTVSPFKQNAPNPAPAKTIETPPTAEEKPVSKILAAKNMFENLSKPSNNLTTTRSLSKSLADLSKDNNRMIKVPTHVISIEDKNTLNKSFDETRTSNQPSQAQLIKVPPAPPLPQPEVFVINNESNKPSLNKITGRKISSATEIKRLEMLEQLKATLGERKVE